ncbi:hypothetical protein [Antribacter gilvus]|uniref:hypothetical protein n=1 Tax=Antribacter gilvus TaxID=2304675 RepID=UPI000F77DC64|nr:hypothetical protein [Antribacter gilvus]
MGTTRDELPVAIGYVGSADEAETARQRERLERYAAGEGLALAATLADLRDVATLSEIADLVREHDAVRVLMHAGAPLAVYQNAVARVVGATGAACTVVADEAPDESRLPHRPASGTLGA